MSNNKEYTGKRDLTYSGMRRGKKDGCFTTDLDYLEWRAYKKDLVAIIETKEGYDNYPTEFQDKIYKTLSSRLKINYYVVQYETEDLSRKSCDVCLKREGIGIALVKVSCPCGCGWIKICTRCGKAEDTKLKDVVKLDKKIIGVRVIDGNTLIIQGDRDSKPKANEGRYRKTNIQSEAEHLAWLRSLGTSTQTF